jgi:beta-glucosidase
MSASHGQVAGEPPADVRAREVERQMTDDERFALLISVMGCNTFVTERDRRIPEGGSHERGVRGGIVNIKAVRRR